MRPYLRACIASIAARLAGYPVGTPVFADGRAYHIVGHVENGAVDIRDSKGFVHLYLTRP